MLRRYLKSCFLEASFFAKYLDIQRLDLFRLYFWAHYFFWFIHLYQSTELIQSLGIFAITFLGGILFAWIFAEWDYNIWIPISLHLFMNLAALMFTATENALGGISGMTIN